MDDDYSAQKKRLEKFLQAGNSIKESLTCIICLGLFKNPVTIKCGHRFCQKCILQVAETNARCPCCNIKIQKRSIPKEPNLTIQACVKHFCILIEAVKEDTGIDDLEPLDEARSTKKATILDYAPSTSNGPTSQINTPKKVNLSQKSSVSTKKKSLESKIGEKSTLHNVEERLNTTAKSTESKFTARTSNKLSLKKKKVNDDTIKTTCCLPNQNLNQYLTDEKDLTQVHSDEKVKSWLENVTPVPPTEPEVTDTILSKRTSITEHIVEELPTTNSKESCKENLLNNSDEFNENLEKKMNSEKLKKKIDKSLKDSKFKDFQKRIQEADLIAKRKKRKQLVPEKPVLKTPSSVTASSHPDAHDWKRIKKVGKEMQAKTFKSLNVSIEKSSPPIVLDDTVQCHSTSNDDSKNASREVDSSGDAFVTKRRRYSKPKSNSFPKENRDEINTIDLLDSPEKEKSSAGVDERKKDKVSTPLTPEKNEDLLVTSNDTGKSRLNSKEFAPLKIGSKKTLCEKEPSEHDSTNLKVTSVDPKNSHPRRKLSLSTNLKSFSNSILKLSSPTPSEKSLSEDSETIKKSPVKPKSKLSLRLQMNKSNETSVNKIKLPENNGLTSSQSKPTNPLFIKFNKMGKLCKKRKKIPFLYLGKMKSKNTSKNSDQLLNISVQKVDKSVQVDLKTLSTEYSLTVAKKDTSKVMNKCKEVKMLSPEEDSQLKFLTIETPHQQQSVDIFNDSNRKKTDCDKQHSSCKEVDKINIVTDIVNQQLDFREDRIENKESNKSMPIIEEIDNLIEPGENEAEKNVNIQTELNYYNQILQEDIEMNEVETTSNIDQPAIENSDRELSEHGDDVAQLSRVIEKDSDSNLSIPKVSPNKKKIDNVQDDEIISISSHDNESRNFESNSQKSDKSDNTIVSRSKNNKISGSESTTESDFAVTKRRIRNKIQKRKSASSSSSLNTSSTKKKRTLSESSTDEILGKWLESEGEPVNQPKSKKQKLSLVSKSDSCKNNKTSSSKVHEIEDPDHTLKGDEQPEMIELHKGPPSENITRREVKNFKEKEAPKVVNMPSSLLSADLFESNNQPFAQPSSKPLNKVISSRSSVEASPNRNKDEVESQSSSTFTMSEFFQFGKNRSNASVCSNGSNKENYQDENQLLEEDFPLDKNNEMDDQVNEIGSSQVVCEVSQKQVLKVPSECEYGDSSMNITQEQQYLKNIEKALLGDLSVVQNEKKAETKSSNLVTNKEIQQTKDDSPEDSDFDSENINATPVAKRRSVFNFITPKPTTNLEGGGLSQEINTPDHNLSLIPAITPVKHRKSYPLCHSTPVIQTEKKLEKCSKIITLISSGLPAENISKVQLFAKKFGAKYLNSYTPEVTHVIIKTDPISKIGQKTFKYIQGIAFKKLVISFEWIVDCLKMNRILDEDDEKYDVLDPDTLESGSKRSISLGQNLFERFAIFCLEPFTSFSVNEFKSILVYNGAEVLSTAISLASLENKYRVIVLESEELTQYEILELKKSKAVLISYEWVVDSISQFKILSLSSYLYETTPEEALAFGFPAEYLQEEETVDEDEEEQD